MEESSSEPPETSERLRRLEAAVVDTELANLDLEDLLEELLERVREILEADTAAILLLDETGSSLIATAARGIEEEVRQGVRVPVGRGFAGRIAAERQPVIIDEVDPSKVFNPILIRKRIRSLLGVPLLAAGELLGVLHVGTLQPRQFSEEDARLLQQVADRMALAAQARITASDRLAVAALQRKLLPGRLPDVPGLETCVRYVPSGIGGLGGDWYDMFVTPNGRLWAVIGDVAGHGLPAAVVMARVRSAFQAYAVNSDDPAKVLSHLDRKLQHFEPSEMATVLCASIDPFLETMTLSSAGHLPPLVVRPECHGYFLDMDIDPPLGVLSDVPRTNHVAKLRFGEAVVLFTDGLVERRGLPISENLERLQKLGGASDVQSLCDAIMADLVGESRLEDDVALLAFQLLPSLSPIDLKVAASRLETLVTAERESTHD